MKITEIPFAAMRLQYRIARVPLRLFEQRVLARVDSEGDVVVGDESAEALRDPPDIQQRAAQGRYPVRRRPRWASAMMPPGWMTETSMMSAP